MNDLSAKLSCCPIVIPILRRKERYLSHPNAQGLFSHAGKPLEHGLALNTPSIIFKAVSIRAGGQVVKGVLVGFGIMVILALIPVGHFVGIPFVPFIGGYFGISAASDNQSSPGRKAMIFGIWTGVLMLIVLAVAATIATALSGVMPLLIWGGVWVFTFYYASMSGLGAWYSELKAKG